MKKNYPQAKQEKNLSPSQFSLPSSSGTDTQKPLGHRNRLLFFVSKFPKIFSFKRVSIFLVLFSSLTFIDCQTQPIDQDQFLIYATFDVLNQNHFADRKTDKPFFDKTLDIYLSLLDPDKIFFTEEEVEALKNNYVPEKDLEPVLQLIARVEETLNSRTSDYIAFAENYLKSPIDLMERGFYETKSIAKNYPKNEKALSKAWQDQIKNSLITTMIVELLPDSSIKSSSEAEEKIQTAKLTEIQKEQQKEVWERIKRVKVNIFDPRGRRQFVETYLKAFSYAYDRHTSYYPPIEKQNFDIAMRGELEGIGAQITKSSDGFIEVVSIIPGGPSYKQKELESGDKIMKVGQGTLPLVDIQSLSLNQGLQLIRGKKGTQVRLMVKKKSEEVKIITITRDRIILEEKFAKSSIFELEGEKLRIPLSALFLQ